jgi:murein DD-endopeptidase MepM/ murein hydrolase activator NlpD
MTGRLCGLRRVAPAVMVAVAVLSACSRTHPAARSPASPSPSAAPSASPSASPVPTPSASTVPRPTPSRPPAATPRTVRYAFPISPSSAARFGHSHHDYPATDIFAPCGATFRAPATGRVLGAQRVDIWNSRVNAGTTRGGLSVTLLGDDGARYYGSHLRAVLASVVPGARVVAGQALGQVGNTGDARGIACHVHFGISPLCGGNTDWYNRRGLVYPWPFLESWRAGGQLSPVAAVRGYQSRYGCPAHATVDP